MSDTPASLEDCNEKLQSFEEMETSRADTLRTQGQHAGYLAEIHREQAPLEAALTTKQAECAQLVRDRDEAAALVDTTAALSAALRSVAINERLAEIAERLAQIWPQLTGDAPSSPTDIPSLRDEAAALFVERDTLQAEHDELSGVVARYTTATAAVERIQTEITACQSAVAELDRDARQNHARFEARESIYQQEVALAESRLNRLYELQGRLIDANCDLHEEIEIPDVDDDPGTTFEDLLAPPEEPEVDDEEVEFEEIEIDDVNEDADEYDDLPDDESD